MRRPSWTRDGNGANEHAAAWTGLARDVRQVSGTNVSMPTSLTPSIAAARLVGRMASGYLTFRRTGFTPPAAFQAMRELYCITNGRANDAMAAISGFLHPPPGVPKAAGALGEFTAGEVGRIAAQIHRDGYCVLERRLPPAIQSALVELGLSAPTKPLVSKPGDGLNNFSFEYLPECRYDRSHVVSAKYVLASQPVVGDAAVQELLTDPLLLSVARSYLNAAVINDDITMWWSTSFLGGLANSAAAQHYHFDMDRIKFLKFFFYLTDVTAETGPHCYVAASHRRKPRQLLRDGRISDEEIRLHYSQETLVEITGPRGTIIAADTRGFHKGKALVSGERLILEFEFATSLFGAEYDKVPVTDRFDDRFLKAVQRDRRTYARFSRA